MAFHFGGRIVRDGLVLHIDPADRNSYIGSGTTVNDLSGNGNTGTLRNGLGFSSDNQGVFILDGNDRIDLGTDASITLSQAITVSAWVRPTSYNTLSGIVNYGNGGYWLYLATTGELHGYIRDAGFTSSQVVPLNIFSNVAITYDKQNVNLYFNGIEVSSSPYTLDIATYLSHQLYIGSIKLVAERHFIGNIGQVLIYNKALSEEDLITNFNCTKSRYGL